MKPSGIGLLLLLCILSSTVINQDTPLGEAASKTSKRRISSKEKHSLSKRSSTHGKLDTKESSKTAPAKENKPSSNSKDLEKLEEEALKDLKLPASQMVAVYPYKAKTSTVTFEVGFNINEAGFFLFEIIGQEPVESIEVETFPHAVKDYTHKITSVTVTNNVKDNPNLFLTTSENLHKACKAFQKICFFRIKIMGYNRNRKMGYFCATNTKQPASLPKMVPLNLPLIKNHPFHFAQQIDTVSESGFNINVYNRFAPLEITAQMLGKSNSDQTVEKKYVTADIWSNVLHIPYDDMKGLKDVAVNFFCNKAQGESIDEDLSQISRAYWYEVQVSDSTKKLKNKHYIEDRLTSNKWSYYIVTKPANKDALVTLTVLDGEADLYVMKGEDVYPDLNTYTYKSTTIKDDELSLPKTGDSATLEHYVVGVLGVTNTRFRVRYSIGQGIKLLKVKSGEVVTKVLKKGESLLLSLDVPYNLKDKVTVGFKGDMSNVEMNARFYDENKETFYDSIPSASNQVATRTSMAQSMMTRVDIDPPKDTSTTQYQLLVKVAPIDDDSEIIAYVVFDNLESIIQLKAGTQITESLTKRNQKYSFSFDNEVADELFEIDVQSGEVKVTIAEYKDFSKDPNPLIVKIKAPPGETIMKTFDLRKDKSASGPANRFFKAYYVLVEVPNYAIYTLTSTKSGSELIALSPGNPNIFTYDPEQRKALYYYISPSAKVKTLQIQFELKSPWYSPQNEDPYKIFEDQETLIRSTEIFFMNENTFGRKSFEQATEASSNAEILDKNEISDSNRKYIVVKIRVKTGFLVIRPKPNHNLKSKFATMVSLLINDIKILAPNSRTMAVLDSKNKHAIYQISLIPQNKLRLKGSVCIGQPVKVYIKHEKGAMLMYPAIVNGLDTDDDSSTFTYEITEGNVPTTLFVHVEYAPKNDTMGSKFSLEAMSTPIDDHITLKSYFNNFKGADNGDGIKYPMTIVQTPDDISYYIAPTSASDNFVKDHPEIDRVSIDYTIYISNEYSNVQESENICDVELFKDKESYYWVRTDRTFIKKDGQFNWNIFEPIKLHMSRYPKTNPPYYGTLQINWRYYSALSLNEVSREAVSMMKVPFVISSKPKHAIFYFICLGIFFTIVAIAVLIFLRFTKKVVEKKIEDRKTHIDYQNASNSMETTGLELN